MSSRVVAAAWVALSAVVPLAAQTAGTIAIANVTVVPMDSERLLLDHTVVVIDGEIRAVGPSSVVTVP